VGRYILEFGRARAFRTSLPTVCFFNRGIEFLFPPTSEARNSMFDEALAHALGATEFFTCSYQLFSFCPFRCY